MTYRAQGTRARRCIAGLAATLAIFAATRTAGAAACLGDCGADAAVTVEEVVSSVRVVLALDRAGQCPGTGTAGAVVAGDLPIAVLNALGGCPDFSGEFATVLPLEGEQVASIGLSVAADGSASGEVAFEPPSASGGRGRGSAAQVVGVSGSVDLATGEFLVTGSYVDNLGHTIEIRLSGRLPRAGDPGSLTLQIGSVIYGGPFVQPPPSPTPTSTPLSGTVHVVKVGQTNLPFDPELVEIEPGDTVTWLWVGGTHSVVSSAPGAPGSPHCVGDGAFASGERSDGSFSHTFTEVGTYEYHCGVAGHCEAFESGIVVVRGTRTPTRTATPTPTPTVPLPTITPTPETVGGVSVHMLGYFNGRVLNDFGGEFPERIQIVVDDFGPFLADITGNLIGPLSTLRLQIESPTKLFANDTLNMRSLTLELQAGGHLAGLLTIGAPPMAYHLQLDLTREP